VKTFSRRRPRAIFIEHQHLDPASKAEMRELLRAHRYVLRDCGRDYKHQKFLEHRKGLNCNRRTLDGATTKQKSGTATRSRPSNTPRSAYFLIR
jgi:hypothetical protein